MKKRSEGENIKARHDERRKKRIREQKLRRILFFSVIALVVVLLVTYLTPIFNIKKVKVSGNAKITTEEVLKQVGEIEGKNLFSYGERRVRKQILKLPYIEKVTLKKSIFPPTVTIQIKENTPSFQIEIGKEFIFVDKNGKVLEKVLEKQEGVALLTGVSVESANVGNEIEYKENATKNIIVTCLKQLEKAGIMQDITAVSFEDTENITFNYQNRLDVVCGDITDIQRKIALFKEAINSNNLTENSRGTINLSTTGKAIYTP